MAWGLLAQARIPSSRGYPCGEPQPRSELSRSIFLVVTLKATPQLACSLVHRDVGSKYISGYDVKALRYISGGVPLRRRCCLKIEHCWTSSSAKAQDLNYNTLVIIPGYFSEPLHITGITRHSLWKDTDASETLSRGNLLGHFKAGDPCVWRRREYSDRDTHTELYLEQAYGAPSTACRWNSELHWNWSAGWSRTSTGKTDEYCPSRLLLPRVRRQREPTRPALPAVTSPQPAPVTTGHR